ISWEFVASCIVYAQEHAQSSALSPAENVFSQLSLLEDYASRTSSNFPSYIVSKLEAMFYYSGISPTPPKLVYRTGSLKTPWIKPTGFEAYRKLKQARGVFGHKLNLVWKTVGHPVGETHVYLPSRLIASRYSHSTPRRPQTIHATQRFFPYNHHPPLVRDLLKTQGLAWTPIDVVRFITDGDGDKKIRGPVVIWQRNPSASRGLMALYFAEGGNSNKVLGLTCHHVLLETDATTNDDYVFTGAHAPRKNVQLLGTRTFDKLLGSIKMRIGRQGIMVGIHEGQIKRLKARVDGDDEEDAAAAEKELRKALALLGDTIEAIENLEKFYEKVKKDWGKASQRIIGHIRSSPAVAFNVGPEGFTEDWGAFELDGPKFKDGSRATSLILVRTEIESDNFTMKMYPCDDGQTTFKYPDDRLLPLRDMITEELMREPDMLEPCLDRPRTRDSLVRFV
ncbi:hypothetical protein FRC06_007752, partial [Ceratobasidium sp. 370]